MRTSNQTEVMCGMMESIRSSSAGMGSVSSMQSARADSLRAAGAPMESNRSSLEPRTNL